MTSKSERKRVGDRDIGDKAGLDDRQGEGRESLSPTRSFKIDLPAVAGARPVAAVRGLDTAIYLSELMRGAVEMDFDNLARRVGKTTAR
jgi:hypothetical protein